jgi:hypothetical protein
MGRTAQQIRSRKQAKHKSNRKKQSALPAFDGVQSPEELQEDILSKWRLSNDRGLAYVTDSRKLKWLNKAISNLIESGEFRDCHFEFSNDKASVNSGVCGVVISRVSSS